jgi:hypothetical protein
MENSAFRSIQQQGSTLTSNSSIASPTRAGPRKQQAVARTLCAAGDDSFDECSTKEKERNRFFRLLSPKKSLARKAQARKNAVVSETARVPALTPESMDAIGILPFSNQGDALRGRVAPRRVNIVNSNQALREIGRAAEDDDSIAGPDSDSFVAVKEAKAQQQQISLAPRPTQVAPYSAPHVVTRKAPTKPDFQASMDLKELLNGNQVESPTRDCRREYSSKEEDDLLALALEKSKTDVGRAPRSVLVSPMRKKRTPLEAVNQTQLWTVKECRKASPVVVSEERLEKLDPKRNAVGSVSIAPGPFVEERRQKEEELRRRDEELRLIDEQEKEMILLAMERSLADVAAQKHCREQVGPAPFRRDTAMSPRPPHRVPYYQSEVPAHRLQDDEDEVARREQEMIQRAMEMSMQDF